MLFCFKGFVYREGELAVEGYGDRQSTRPAEDIKPCMDGCSNPIFALTQPHALVW